LALAAGYRIGMFTPMLTVGRFRETKHFAPDTVSLPRFTSLEKNP